MKYKLNNAVNDVGPTISFGSTLDNCPDYNFDAPYDVFDKIGLYELMEGIFEYNPNNIDKIKQKLTELGYEEIE